VNRVFRDNPGGLVVDYLGLAHELKAALATYTESGGTGSAAVNQREAVALMLAKYEVCCGLFHGFDWSIWTSGSPTERLGLLPAAQEHILAQEDGKDRLLGAVHELSQAFALAVPHADALRIRDDVAFFQAMRASLAKRAPGEAKTQEEAGSRRQADCVTGGRVRRGRGHLRRGGPGQAGCLDPFGRVPRRGAGDAAAQPGGRVAAEAAAERDQVTVAAERRRAGRSRTCWSRRCGSTRTERSRPPR
jgi:hypothetical protein